MPIDFHAQQNRTTYTARSADASWLATISENVTIAGKQAADIGCGGGIYTKALRHLGAAQVTGVDFSAAMLQGAAQNCEGLAGISFVQGHAYDTGLPDQAYEIVLERALIHHLDDLNRCFQEARRILKEDGMFIVQDRTPQDCIQPGSESHFRGYFFDQYPRLLDVEIARRPDATQVRKSLEANGFEITEEVQLWETRRTYDDLATLRQDLLQRTGRSILHELSDDELRQLVQFIQSKLETSTLPIVEKDSWTIWFATRRSHQK